MARHLLVLEGLARILAAAGRPDRAVRDRHAVRSAQAAEVPALDAARETLARRRAGHVDELPRDEMVGRDLGADRNDGIIADPKLGELLLRLDLGDGEATALGRRDVLHLRLADADLQGRIAVLVLRPMGDDLAAVELQD